MSSTIRYTSSPTMLLRADGGASLIRRTRLASIRHRGGAEQLAAARCSEVGDARGLLSNHACVVFIQRSGAIPFHKDVGIRPYRKPGTAIAACFVAHDVAPFRTVDKPVPVRKWRHCPIDLQLMAGTNEMS